VPCTPPLRPVRATGPPVPLVPTSLAREPGASITRSTQLRPDSGISESCFASRLPPTEEFFMSTSGASPVTVTDSCTVEGDICRSSVAVWPTSSVTPVRAMVAKPGSSAVILNSPMRTGMR
jgi:hypothetical protein